MTATDIAPDEHSVEVGQVATPEFEAANERLKQRQGLLLALPAYLYLAVFFALPLVIVLVYSLATRNRFGGNRPIGMEPRLLCPSG